MIQSIVKAFTLLDLLGRTGEMTAVELAEGLEEPRASVYRILRTLEAEGCVESGSRRGTFRLSFKLVRLGNAVLETFDVRRSVLPALEKLHGATRETVYLCVRRGHHAVAIERLDGEHLHSLLVKLGDIMPLHIGAAPRTLLAYEPRSFWEEYFSKEMLTPWTDRSPTTREEVIGLLEETLRTGVSVSDEDVTVGYATLGVPIFDHRGKAACAIAFSAPRSLLLSDRLPEYVGLVTAAGIEASRALGYEAARTTPFDDGQIASAGRSDRRQGVSPSS